MARKDEDYLFECIEQIKYETHQNNLMLQDICKAISTYLANHHQENEADFGRNILANLISNGIDITRFFKK